MELNPHQKQALRGWRPVVLGLILCCICLSLVQPTRQALNSNEALCAGAWCFINPDRPTTLVVYHFGRDRRICEEHFYLTSGRPNVPVIRMLGQWRVETEGQSKARLIVEPSVGMHGLSDQASGVIEDMLEQDWPRPVLRRFYSLISATPQKLTFQASRSGGKGRVEIVMQPFDAPPSTFLVPSASSAKSAVNASTRSGESNAEGKTFSRQAAKGDDELNRR